MKTRRRKHDDAHYPLAGKGACGWRPKGPPVGTCHHQFVTNCGERAGCCARCGDFIAPELASPLAHVEFLSAIGVQFESERNRWRHAAQLHGLHPEIDRLLQQIIVSARGNSNE
ncbi:hypothetical protein XAC3608_2030008 [Xanthomonas citri pv. citri]|nr:hypothetical protein XAC3608_2030008 [Xanthomonas citri pv. citri]